MSNDDRDKDQDETSENGTDAEDGRESNGDAEDESSADDGQESNGDAEDESSADSSPPSSDSGRISNAEGTAPTRRTVLIAFVTGAAGGLAGGFGLGYWWARRRRRGRPRKPPRPAYVPVPSHAARKGPWPAKVTIVEFSEFQCPYCARAVPVLDEVLKKYPRDVAVVFRNNPLPFHKNAKGAAIALQAANRQGKAWDLHDLMFENQKQLTPADLLGHAEEVGLDLDQFKRDMEDPAVLAEVQADMKAAREAGATGTPAFFINGSPVRGAKPLDAFVEVIDQELKRADELIAAGTPLAEVYETRARELVAKVKPAGSATTAKPK